MAAEKNNGARGGLPTPEFAGMRDLIGMASFGFLMLVTAAVVYFDDIQLAGRLPGEAPTIYNVRFLGVKLIDILSLGLLFVAACHQFFRETIRVTPVHRNLLIIFGIYCYAAVVGFAYSFAFAYDYQIWLQDFQQVVYLLGYFLLTYHLLDSKGKWRAYVVAFLVLLAAKNYLILYQTMTGVGKAIGDWAFRASQNAEFTYFPMLFFPLVLLMLRGRSLVARMIFGLTALVYVFNSLLGIYRTVWVMLILGTAYLMLHLSTRERWKFAGMGVLVLLLVVGVISLMFPRFVDLAFGFKFMTIFDWSTGGDRSNATRMLEVVNVGHRLLAHSAVLHGMGLGAWWDDSAARLLQDYGSGFTFKWRYHSTHMWYVTQLLKLGLIGTVLYWFALYRIFTFNLRSWRRAATGSWEDHVVLGLLVGLLCAIISSADFVRMFLVMGINIGILTSYATLFAEQPARPPDQAGGSERNLPE